MDCSTWFLVEKQSKKTYPLPLGFQHTQYCCEPLASLQVGSFGAVLLGCMLNSIEQIDFRLHHETANRACCMLLENPWITPQSKKQLLPRFNDFAEFLLQSWASLGRFNDSAYLFSVNVEHDH